MKAPIIIGVTLLVVAGAGAATFFALRQIAPHKTDQATQQQAASLSTGDMAREQGAKLLQEQKLDEAKAAYQKAADAYTTENNTVAASDAKLQISIIESTAKSTSTNNTQQTPPRKSSGGGS